MGESNVFNLFNLMWESSGLNLYFNSLEPIRLTFPALPSYTAVLVFSRGNPSDVPAALLLYTLLWLVMPRLSGVPSNTSFRLASIMEELGNKLLADENGRDAGYAPLALELLFCYCPLALGTRLGPGQHAGSFYGLKILDAALRFGQADAGPLARHRMYWDALLTSDWPPKSMQTPRYLSAPRTLFEAVGAAASRQRIALVKVVKKHERRLEGLELELGEITSTGKLASSLQTLLDAFLRAISDRKEGFARDLGKSSSSAASLAHRC